MLWAAGSWSWPRCWLFPDSPWGRSIPVYCRLPALRPRDQLGVEESESWVAPCVFSQSRGNLEVLGDYSSPPLLNIGFSRRQGGRSLDRPRCHLIPGTAHSAHILHCRIQYGSTVLWKWSLTPQLFQVVLVPASQDQSTKIPVGILAAAGLKYQFCGGGLKPSPQNPKLFYSFFMSFSKIL